MNRLKNILNNKKISNKIKNAISYLYEAAINFWGEDKEELVLKVIEEFEIISLNDLGEELVKTQNKIDTVNGIAPNTIGLCIVLPIIEQRKITKVRRIILLEEKKTEEEIASLLAHELFFHGVKTMFQPKLNDNILFLGLIEKKYFIDESDNIINMKQNGNFGFEELSTYYGQNRLMEEVYNKKIDIDPVLLVISCSLGEIIERTSLGKLMLEAQLTKDISELEQKFSKVEEKRLLISNSDNKMNWDDYNKLMDNYMILFYKIHSLSETDLIFQEVLKEYEDIFQKLLEINTQILFAATMLDSQEIAKANTKKLL